MQVLQERKPVSRYRGKSAFLEMPISIFNIKGSMHTQLLSQPRNVWHARMHSSITTVLTTLKF